MNRGTFASQASWRLFEPLLTPAQRDELWTWEATGTHPNGPDAHRRGLISVALLYSLDGAALSN
ncbi:MAG: hypothetical protein AB7G47_08305 [Mycolicibacterium sp.]|uniref:hypothetical protein n=1 Tax=Mycolicibacterium sp. TaxID=2320850 RepID=UPI003D0E6FF7